MASRTFTASRLPGFATVAIVVFIALYMPIAMLMIYSFNAGDSIAIWDGFSFQWYERAWENEKVKEVTIRSLVIAGSAATISTVAATMAALATTRKSRSAARPGSMWRSTSR